MGKVAHVVDEPYRPGLEGAVAVETESAEPYELAAPTGDAPADLQHGTAGLSLAGLERRVPRLATPARRSGRPRR